MRNPPNKRQDHALLQAFHMMDRDEREFFLEIALTHTAGRSMKPSLQLIHGGRNSLSTFMEASHA